tara:strand:+ start:20 stop:1180 length:1161 start_codon:yes stop_codon:yes gene_type:complete
MTRVAFVINFTHHKWLGGFNIIMNLIKALYLLKNRKIDPILIVSKNFKKKEIQNFKNVKVIKSDFFLDQNLLSRIYNKISILTFGKSEKYDNFFIKHKIKVLSHTLLPLGKKSLIKSFPWIPDFQYIHYPENFSLKNKFMKNLSNKICAKHSSKIILSSNDVKNDVKKLTLKGFLKSRINSFVFDIPSKKKITSLSLLKKKYKIKSKYFYLPNQYWVHKNHILVLKSLKKVITQNKSIVIVSTGYADDHRSLGYFQKIKDYLKKNNLKQNFQYLGLVPYNDVMSLMYHSVAVLNPSKFEGWSSSVEQAKSMGKKIVLSNINVHKEQNPKRGMYFNPNDFNKLSSIMIKTWENFNLKKEHKFINIAYKNLNKRLIKYAEEYQKIILE